MKNKRIKIVLGLTLAFFLTKFISSIFFINQTPSINRNSLNNLKLSFNQKLKAFFSQKKSTKNPSISPTPSSLLAKNKNSNFQFEKISPKPTRQPTQTLLSPTIKPKEQPPTPTPTIKPKEQPPTPTLFPSLIPSPPQPTKTLTFFSCPKLSSNIYMPIDVIKINTTDINSRDDLALPPFVKVSAQMDVFYSQVVDPDPKIPVFNEIFSPPKRPEFIAGYKSTREIRGVYEAEVEILEVKTTPGETLRFPYTAYDIGGNFRAMVLYVSDNAVTFKIGREDDIVYGYTIYFENLCPDPNLKSLYEKLNAEGRKQLIAIKEEQIFGLAKDTLKIAVRDTGTFLDIRQIDPETGLGFWR